MLLRFMALPAFLVLLSLQLTAQSLSDSTERFTTLYQEFRYQEVIRQGEAYLDQKPDLTDLEKCEILRLIALSYFARQDMQGALKNFSEILKYDENYHLDPIKNSPKILSFFEEIRRQYQQNKKTVTRSITDTLIIAPTPAFTDSLTTSAHRQMALSFLLPGSGQLSRGKKIKGWLLLAGNFSLLGTSVYFIVETNRLNDYYLHASETNEIAEAYDDYNQAYRKRNIALTGFALVWLYTQIDFLFLSSPSNQQAAIRWYPTIKPSGTTALNVSLSL